MKDVTFGEIAGGKAGMDDKVFKFLIAAFYKRLMRVIKFCFHIFHEKKEKKTTSSVEKILDAIVLAKHVIPYVLLL